MRRDADPTDRVAVVTGASSGIGRAIARGLGGQGATVALVARHHEALQVVAEEITVLGGNGRCFPADLATPDEVIRLLDRITREFPWVDVLVHSAGLFPDNPRDKGGEDPARILQVNTYSPQQLTEALLPQLRVRRGQVVFINSSVGVPNAPGVGPYPQSKQALRSFADRLRARVNPDGIRVLSVYPGRTATPMQAAVRAAEGLPYQPERLLQPEDIAVMVLQALSLPETAEVTDLSIRPLLPS